MTFWQPSASPGEARSARAAAAAGSCSASGTSEISCDDARRLNVDVSVGLSGSFSIGFHGDARTGIMQLFHTDGEWNISNL